MKRNVKKLPSGLLAAGVGVATWLVAATAYAAEGTAGGTQQAGGISQILPPLGEFVPAFIAFVILFLIMWKFALPGVVNSIDERADRIRDSLEKAEGARIEGERLLEEYKLQLAEARKEAAAVLADAKAAGEAARAEATTRAAAEADALIEKARKSIEGEKRAAIAELQSSVAELSVAVAGKVIGSELSAKDHLEVVRKYLAEAGSLNAN